MKHLFWSIPLLLLCSLCFADISAQTANSKQPPLYPIIQNKKVGFANDTGKIIIPCIWDEVRPFVGDFAKVQKEGDWGAINRQGKLVVPCKYWEISDFVNGLATFIISEPRPTVGFVNTCGFVTSKGKEILLPYLEVYPFNNQCMVVKSKQHKYGLINTKGQEILACEYDKIDTISTKILAVSKSNKWGLVSNKGKVVAPCEYDQLQKIYTAKDIIQVSKAGKWGLINTETLDFFPCVYDDLQKYSDIDMPALFIARQNNKVGLINTRQQVIIPFVYDEIQLTNFGADNYFYLAAKENLWGIISLKGEEIYPSILKVNPDELCAVANKYVRVFRNNQWEIIDIKNKTSRMYPKIGIFNESAHFLAAQDSVSGKWGIVRYSGEIVVPFIYAFTQITKENAYFVVSSDGQTYGFLDSTGKKVSDLVYTECNNFEKGLSVVKKDNKWGVINTSGEAVITFKYDNMFPPSLLPRYGDSIRFITNKQQQRGILNISSKKEIVPMEYEQIQRVNNNYFAQKNNHWGLLSKTGEVLTSFVYDNMRSSRSHILHNAKNIIVSQSLKYGILSIKGVLIAPCVYEQIEQDEPQIENWLDAIYKGKTVYIDRWGNDTAGNTRFIGK